MRTGGAKPRGGIDAEFLWEGREGAMGERSEGEKEGSEE